MILKLEMIKKINFNFKKCKKSNLILQEQVLDHTLIKTKTSPRTTVGKANQNFVQFWCEVEQTGPTRLS